MTNNKINKKDISYLVLVRSYDNADIHKNYIFIENANKTGIYVWTYIVSNKSYVGSCLDLSVRLKKYFNISYLERETNKNNSLIYRVLLKYSYHSFKLDILEYCDPLVLINREQYYLDNFNFKYNILKIARSLVGFKHNTTTLERMSKAKLGRIRNETTKLKLSSNTQAHAIFLIDNNTKETKVFTSIRKTAEFIGIHHSYLAKCLNENKIYIRKGYTIVKKNIKKK